MVADVFGGAQGLLGIDGMKDKRIYIDFRNDFINVSIPEPSRGGRVRHGAIPENETAAADGERKVGNLLHAIIDTGAQASVGNQALRHALATRYVRKHNAIDEITGATGEMQPGTAANISTLSIGNLTLRGARVTFGDMQRFDHWKLRDEPILLIGMDVIGLLDTLVIDYRRRELHIRARISG